MPGVQVLDRRDIKRCLNGHSDNSYQATTHIKLKKRQLISGDNSYQFEKATTHIGRQLI